MTKEVVTTESIRGVARPSPRAKNLPDTGWGPAAFVWGVWALMLLVTLAAVGWFGRNNVPTVDDWAWVPYLTGKEPITLTWLWSQHNEHRNLLVRLILLPLYKLTGCDFRAGMFLSVLALGALSFAMILAAKRLRGWLTYSDAFFPFVLLHLGQGEIFSRSHSADIVIPSIVVGVFLIIMVRSSAQSRVGMAVLAGICLNLLPLCGAMGLARVPTLAVWLGYWGFLHWCSPTPRGKRNALVIWGMVLSALLLTGFYFVGYEQASHHPRSPSHWASLVTGVEFLSMSFGPSAMHFRTLSGLGVLALLLVSAAALIIMWRTQPRGRLRTLGLFMFLGGIGLLALGVGVGRAGFGAGSGLAPRYCPSAVLALCCVYYIWGTCASRAVGSFGQMCLFTLAGCTVALNTLEGLNELRTWRKAKEAFEQDLISGVPTSLLVKHHSSFVVPEQEYLVMLKDAGIGNFRYLQGDPPSQDVSLPVEPIDLNQMTWEKPTAYGSGNEPYLSFALPESRFVYSIRITFALSTESGPAAFQLLWKRQGQNDFPSENSASLFVSAGPKERVLTIPIWDTIDYFRIRPDNKPCAFKIQRIELLVPVNVAE